MPSSAGSSEPAPAPARAGTANTAGAPVRPRRGRARRLAFAALALGIGCALAGLLAEVLLRTLGADAFPELETVYAFHELDADGQVRVQADWSGSKRVRGRTVTVRTNSFGLRGPEPPAPAPGQRRVLFLGDSMPFGHGVEDHEAFPERTARLLSERLGKSVVAGNAGIPRNPHAAQVRDFRRHLPTFAPDVVVSCVYAGNDFHDDFAGPMTVVDGFLFDTAGARLASSSVRARLSMRSRLLWKVEQFLAAYVPALAYDRSPLQPTAEERTRFDGFPAQGYDAFEAWQDLFMDALEPLPIVTAVLDRMTATLTTLRDEVGESDPDPVRNRRRPLVVVIPTWVQAHAQVYEQRLATGLHQDPARYRRGLGAERLAERCASLGLPVLDLTPVIAAHPQPQLLFLLGDGHLSPEGHRVAAEAIAAFLAPFVP